MRFACTLLLVTPLIYGCTNGSNQDELNKLSAKVSALSARVTALEVKAQHHSENNAGSWILWQRLELVKANVNSGFVVTGPAPARPMGAFDTKESCEHGAAAMAAAHGAPAGVPQYYESDVAGVNRVFFTCLPRGVAVTF